MAASSQSPIQALRHMLLAYTNRSRDEESTLSISDLKASLQAVDITHRFSTLASQFDNGATFLHRAALDGRMQLICCILEDVSAQDERYALIKIQDNSDMTVLHTASKHCKVELVKCILGSITAPEERYALLLVPNKEGKTALHFSSRSDSADTVRYMLDSIASENRYDLLKIQDNEGKTSLHYIGSSDSTIALKYMLDSVSPENRHQLLMAQDNEGDTLMHCASLSNSTDIIKYVLESLEPDSRYALFMVKNNNGETSLHCSIQAGSSDLVRYALESISFDSNMCDLLMAKDSKDRTCMHWASSSSSVDTVIHLLNVVPSGSVQKLLLLQDYEGKTALHRASWSGSGEVLKCLLRSVASNDRDALLMSLDHDGKTALHYASLSPDPLEKIKHILDSVAPQCRRLLLLIQDKEGKTVLHHVCRSVETVKCLLSFLTPENQLELLKKQDYTRRTSLHCASLSGSEDTLKCMLDFIQMDSRQELLMSRDIQGNTPLHYACWAGSVAKLKCILEFVAVDKIDKLLTVQDNEGKTALHRVASSVIMAAEKLKYILIVLSSSSTEMLELLKLQCKDGDTPVHLMSLNAVNLMPYIIDYMPQMQLRHLLKIQNHRGFSILHHVTRSQTADVLKLVLESIADENRYDIVKLQDFEGSTVLHYAARENKEKYSCILDHLTLAHRRQLHEIQNNSGRKALDVVLDPRKLVTSTLQQAKTLANEQSKSFATKQSSFATLKPGSASEQPGSASEQPGSVSGQPAVSGAAHSGPSITAQPVPSVVEQLTPPAIEKKLTNTQGHAQQSATSKTSSGAANHSSSPSCSSVCLSETSTTHLKTDALISSTLLSNNWSSYTAQLQSAQILPQFVVSKQEIQHPIQAPQVESSNTLQYQTLSNRYPFPVSAAGFTQLHAYRSSPVVPASASLLAASYPPTLSTSSASYQQLSATPSTQHRPTLTAAASLSGPGESSSTLLRYGVPSSSQHGQPASAMFLHSASNQGSSSSTSYKKMAASSSLNSAKKVVPDSATREVTSTVAGKKRDAPMDLSRQWAAGDPKVPKVTRYEGSVKGCTVKLKYRGKGYIFPFMLSTTVSTLTQQVQDSIGLSCTVKDEEGFQYTSGVPLNLVDFPFLVTIGDSETLVTAESAECEPKASTSSALGEGSGLQRDDGSEERTMRFGRVVNARQVIELLTFVHEQVLSGKTVNGALKLAEKDRKTVDRFKNIYYLHVLDSDRLMELDTEWRNNGKKRALPGLDEMARREIDWDQLEQLAAEDKVTLFGGIRKAD